MTKTILRFLLLSAVALPLAHACSDSSLECLGTAVACENRDLNSCDHGCSVRSGCLGEAEVTCESLTDNPTLCLQTGACRYVGTCEGAEGCPGVRFDECASTPGCEEVIRCYGESVRCETLEDSQCELYPQCQLGSECRGSATSCGDIGSATECLQVPGCYPADTTPSVVGAASTGP